MTRRYANPGLVVVKVGSSSLRGEDGLLDRSQIASLCGDIAAVRDAGIRVILVSSGAVAAGMGQLGMDRRPSDLPTLQACAAVGQGELIHTYQQQLRNHGLRSAQILLTQDDFVRRHRYLNGRTTLYRLLQLGAVPVVNENDAIATDELAYGDNDRLAALVASMLDADLLVLLSDVDGLHAGDPRTHDRAPVIDRVDRLEDLDLGAIGGRGSFVGSGGMRSKVEAAGVAVASGAHAVVANARRPGALHEVVEGAKVGTWFVAQPRRLEARRLWIGFALAVRGRVFVDAGAVRALRERGTSLLSVGVTDVEGDFDAGDAVEVVDPGGQAFARGLSNFEANDVRRIAGHSTGSAAAAFGTGFAREVIHRDNLVLLASPSR